MRSRTPAFRSASTSWSLGCLTGSRSTVPIRAAATRHKYLKARKGRTLSLDEINYVAAIADRLAFTIEQMARIDEAYKAAFPDRG